MPESSYNDFAIYRRLLAKAWPYKFSLLGVFLVSLLAPPLALLTPLPVKIAVDSILGGRPLPGFLHAILPAGSSRGALLLLAGAMVLLVALLQKVQELAGWVLETYLGEKLVLDFRTEIFRHVQRLSLSYHDRVGTADSVYRIQTDAHAIQYIVIWGILPFISAALTLVGVFYVTARIDLTLSLVAIAVSPALMILIARSGERLRSRWVEVKEYETSAMAVVQEALGSIRVVKAFGREEHEHSRFAQRASRSMRGQVEIAFLSGSFFLWQALIMAAGAAAVLVIGIRRIDAGAITLGELLMVMAYLTQLYAPLQTISKKTTELHGSTASAARAFSILDHLPDITDRPKARALTRARGAISFRDVGFAYDPNRPVLEKIAFDVKPGSHIGIAGATGAGKTTLVNLMTRFYDPTRGEILLDGVDIREYRVADLRNQFTIVLQEPVLFSTSIGENIAYARPGASQKEIEDAARAANAHEFILGLPEGYATLVGERGMLLSGGERQRISLARAFLKDSPIMILDEPTSSVDVETESKIMEAMERLIEGRTAFMIAHRLSTLDNCDVRLRLERGLLVEASERPMGVAQ